MAVTTTGVYCRIGCPSRTPAPDHVRFFPSPVAAEAAGFRACKRCRPNAGGEPERALVSAALRLIAAGAADGGGIGDLARRLGVSSRTLDRRFTEVVGASPLQLARSRRVQTARALIAQTSMPLVDVAFAAGFGSLRQFNDTMRQELGVAPGMFRDGAPDPRGRDGQGDEGPPAASGQDGRGDAAGGPGAWLTLRLAHREPLAAAPLLSFLAARAIPGVECRHRLDLHARPPDPRRSGGRHRGPWRRAPPAPRVRLDDMAGVGDVVRRCRRLLDLELGPGCRRPGLGGDPLLRRLVAAHPGLRVPGSAEPFETAVRAVLGQQVSVGAARTLAARLVVRLGEPAERCRPAPSPTSSPRRTGSWRPTSTGSASPGAGSSSIRALSRAVASGELDLTAGDPGEVDAQLAGLPGFGPWTRAYIADAGPRRPRRHPRSATSACGARWSGSESRPTRAASPGVPRRGAPGAPTPPSISGPPWRPRPPPAPCRSCPTAHPTSLEITP